MASFQRRLDKGDVVREFAVNRIDALERLREALANPKDHNTMTVWIKTVRGVGAKPEPEVFLFNDGERMRRARHARARSATSDVVNRVIPVLTLERLFSAKKDKKLSRSRTLSGPASRASPSETVTSRRGGQSLG